MKIIGAGFGRTGTKSLQLALNQLGFNCYHMMTLFENTNHIHHWEDAAHGRTVDWETLFHGYDAIVDFPGSFYYKELIDIYPNAKVILTIRSPESWYESTYKTIYSFKPNLFTKLKLLISSLFVKKANELIRIVKMNNLTIWKKTFKGRFENKNEAIDIFNQNIEEVIRHVPKERLLILDIKEGWKPLCNFLNLPVPSAEFPKSNQSADFKDTTRNFLSLK